MTVSGQTFCDQSKKGNNLCYLYNNHAACDYDGGDCCDYENPKNCRDTGSTNYVAPYVCDNVLTADGYCDSDINSFVCGYDGGDCCNSTCTSENHNCGYNGYNCIDPDAIDFIADICPLPDGKCNHRFNHILCNYDQGDCCREIVPYQSVDCKNPRSDNYLAPQDCASDVNGLCDFSKNKFACNYDNGNCCESTCQGTSCGLGGYFCIDADAIDFNADLNDTLVYAFSREIEEISVKNTIYGLMWFGLVFIGLGLIGTAVFVAAHFIYCEQLVSISRKHESNLMKKCTVIAPGCNVSYPSPPSQHNEAATELS